ncbi:molybdopterin molybdotransferase MoeA [Flavobacterium psychrotolerans]|uniref:Molybdopterin molybdenumtransferase n=1 Tax=Flavobacterium psychrotolerans TaxID=2169410 RepID=A0A2U1JHL1_9FLAO|nr:gephyrin-like molybdotransferase Glp [Flavobacterium psychrotolerans]PWA04617.1 molybdopterin molybdenumtransferase MoeA [Flavobacterium psychrotolerans]
MIQVDQALSIIAENCCKMPIRKIKVAKSLGFILAETIFSPMDMPPFRQSSMDGYAFLHSELQQFDVVNTLQAGGFLNKEIKKNQAVRIFTGAFVPDHLDTVVMQEHTTVENKTVEITKMPSRFANVRNKGEQIKENELVFEKNTLITPAAIGFLACLGITEIRVYAKPKVAIVVTGNELVKAGKKLPRGKIFESNSIMLNSCLQGVGIKKIEAFRVKDNLKATEKILKHCLSAFDVVLVSGGISVGDYDFVKEALLSNGVEELFYKINQKPGKPLFFGKKDKTIVFALPGNPASTLTSFYIYVHPALKINMGFEAIHLPKIKRKISSAIENTSGKTLFLKGFYDDEKVSVLESQSSAMLNTFAVANALIYLPYDVANIEKDLEVMVIPLN